MLIKWNLVNGVPCIVEVFMKFLKEMIKWIAMAMNLAVVLLIAYSFYDAEFVVYAVVMILGSFALNEAMVESRLQKVEEAVNSLFDEEIEKSDK